MSATKEAPQRSRSAWIPLVLLVAYVLVPPVVLGAERGRKGLVLGLLPLTMLLLVFARAFARELWRRRGR
jgi:hypothetical protein